MLDINPIKEVPNDAVKLPGERAINVYRDFLAFMLPHPGIKEIYLVNAWVGPPVAGAETFTAYLEIQLEPTEGNKLADLPRLHQLDYEVIPFRTQAISADDVPPEASPCCNNCVHNEFEVLRSCFPIGTSFDYVAPMSVKYVREGDPVHGDVTVYFGLLNIRSGNIGWYQINEIDPNETDAGLPTLQELVLP